MSIVYLLVIWLFRDFWQLSSIIFFSLCCKGWGKNSAEACWVHQYILVEGWTEFGFQIPGNSWSSTTICVPLLVCNPWSKSKGLSPILQLMILFDLKSIFGHSLLILTAWIGCTCLLCEVAIKSNKGSSWWYCFTWTTSGCNQQGAWSNEYFHR